MNDPWVCRFGFRHAVPQLAAECTGKVHGLGVGWRGMSLRVCAEPGCPALVQSGRCATHRRARDRARGTRQERGYDAAHDRLRAEYQARMNRGEAFDCWRCGYPIDPEHWHLGHDDEDRSVYRGPECVPCNTATSGR